MTTPTTTALRMVRGDVDLREFNRWMGSRRLQDPDHAMHCLLKECFGELAPKPFRLVATRGASRASLYGYGRADAGALRESAAICACPLQERILPPSGLASKPMPTEWRVGLRLGFELRVRPIVRLERDQSRVPDDRNFAFRDGGRRGGEGVRRVPVRGAPASAGRDDTDSRGGVRRLARQAVRAARRRGPGQTRDQARVLPANARGAKAAQALQRRPRRPDARRA